MSEYQYYEFRAVDRPLDDRAMRALRNITSRAEITPTSLVNEYQWGDFKGNPDQLMDKYFDAHLYFANWGTHRLMLRLPASSLPIETARPYLAPDTLKVRKSGENVVIDFFADSEGADLYYEEHEGSTLASLISLRTDLAAGDLRCVYLGWLAGVQAGDVDEDAVEPPVPPGLGRLNGALNTLAEFIYLDDHLLTVAASASNDEVPRGPSAEEVARWVAQLPRAEADRAIVRLMQGEGGPLAAELMRRFRTDVASRQVTPARSAKASTRRTAGDLLAAADRMTREKERKVAERRAREDAKIAREKAEARTRELDSLAARGDSVWLVVETAIRTTRPKEYERAIKLLTDLRDLAERSGDRAGFASRVRELRGRHAGKPALMERFDKAGLPE